MEAVLLFLGRLVSMVSGLTTIANNILNLLGVAATEQTAQAILDQANAIYGAVTDRSNGLAAIKADVDALAIQLALVESTLAAQIGAPLQAGSVVTLPTTPPPAYGGGDPTSVASAVWSYFIVSAGNNASDVLSNAGVAGLNLDRAFVSLPTAIMPPILIGGPWANPINPPPVDSLGQSVDFTTILPTDLTPADWMNRVNPTLHVWEMHNDYARFIEDTSGFYYTLNISQWEFQQLRDGLTAKIPPQPPIWPGADLVTFGEGSLAHDGDQIMGPLDGVDVVIARAPDGTQQFQFGPDISYGHLGAIAFFDETGHYEAPQNLGFVSAKYLPKSFQHAGGVTIRVKSGTDLSWYPFTINP